MGGAGLMVAIEGVRPLLLSIQPPPGILVGGCGVVVTYTTQFAASMVSRPLGAERRNCDARGRSARWLDKGN